MDDIDRLKPTSVESFAKAGLFLGFLVLIWLFPYIYFPCFSAVIWALVWAMQGYALQRTFIHLGDSARGAQIVWGVRALGFLVGLGLYTLMFLIFVPGATLPTHWEGLVFPALLSATCVVFAIFHHARTLRGIRKSKRGI